MKKKNVPSSTKNNLTFEKDFLKTRFPYELGMKKGDKDRSFPREVEREWLNHMLEWEKQLAEIKMIKLYDRIGRPKFRKIGDLKEKEIPGELRRLSALMKKNNLLLNCICEYPDATIYKFITEELFEEEIQDIRIKGKTKNFIYEEFHPNHEDDIRSLTEDVINYLFRDKDWYEELTKRSFDDTILFKEKVFINADFNNILFEIHASHQTFNVTEIKIKHLQFDIKKKKAESSGQILYDDNGKNKKKKFRFGMIYNDFYWAVSEFMML